MGLRNEFQLQDKTGTKLILVTPLNNGVYRLWNIKEHYNCDQYLMNKTQLDAFKQKHNLISADQTSIFDFI